MPKNLLDSHIKAWQETWNEARIEIEGDLKLVNTKNIINFFNTILLYSL